MRRPSALALLFLAGCASVGGMRAAPATEGSSWAFSAPAAKVHEAACEALRSHGMYLLEVGRPGDTAWSALAQKTSLWSYGEYVRVTVLPADSAGLTPAYFLTRRLVATNITASDDWSARLIHRMVDVLAGRREPRENACEITPAARAAAGS
ncbi:MAG TPA: hypothetical protein VLA95_09540 [Gemmatimonadales bacterium]|nr:hypothetical protein [Gemmatimonadales bacterium]